MGCCYHDVSTIDLHVLVHAALAERRSRFLFLFLCPLYVLTLYVVLELSLCNAKS